ncbi:MAG: hypothetical protein ACKO34_00515 [Vampirovibrionales bacterium]
MHFSPINPNPLQPNSVLPYAEHASNNPRVAATVYNLQSHPCLTTTKVREGFGFTAPPFEAKAPHIYSELEKRLRTLAPFVLVPALRYVQDKKEDRNRLFWRDFGSIFTGTMLYFTGVSLYGTLAHKVFKLPEKTKALEFWSHLPAQVTALTVSAFLGPKISDWFSVQTKQVDTFFKNPDPMNTVNEWWEEEGRTKRAKPHIQSTLVGVGLFSVLTPALLSLVKEKQAPEKSLNQEVTTMFDTLLTLWSRELPVVITALEISVFTALKLDHALVNRSCKSQQQTKK